MTSYLQNPASAHQVKWIKFFGKDRPIILQNENGPCPLIAIANCLLLNKRITLDKRFYAADNSWIVQQVNNYITAANPQKDVDPRLWENMRALIADVKKLMPRLETGMDVNPQFADCEGFEFTPELSVFDLTGVRLVHGWVADRGEPAASALGDGLSYNHAVELVINMMSALATEAAAAEPAAVAAGAASGAGGSAGFAVASGAPGGSDIDDAKLAAWLSMAPSTTPRAGSDAAPTIPAAAGAGGARGAASPPAAARQTSASASGFSAAALSLLTLSPPPPDDASGAAAATTAFPPSAPLPSPLGGGSRATSGRSWAHGDGTGRRVISDGISLPPLAVVGRGDDEMEVDAAASASASGDAAGGVGATTGGTAVATPASDPASVGAASDIDAATAAAIAAAQASFAAADAAEAAAVGAGAAAATAAAAPAGGDGTAAATGAGAAATQAAATPTAPMTPAQLARAAAVDAWMKENASQLTLAGLAVIAERLVENEVAVFFRNNHFSTIFKHAGALYLLVTDEGYRDVPEVVWERLDNVFGDTLYVDETFTPPSAAAGGGGGDGGSTSLAAFLGYGGGGAAAAPAAAGAAAGSAGAAAAGVGLPPPGIRPAAGPGAAAPLPPGITGPAASITGHAAPPAGSAAAAAAAAAGGGSGGGGVGALPHGVELPPDFSGLPEEERRMLEMALAASVGSAPPTAAAPGAAAGGAAAAAAPAAAGRAAAAAVPAAASPVPAASPASVPGGGAAPTTTSRGRHDRYGTQADALRQAHAARAARSGAPAPPAAMDADARMAYELQQREIRAQRLEEEGHEVDDDGNIVQKKNACCVQ